MSSDTRMSISLRKRPCWNRYPGGSGTRFPSTAVRAPALEDLAAATSAAFALCSVSEDAARRHDISLPATDQPHHSLQEMKRGSNRK